MHKGKLTAKISSHAKLELKDRDIARETEHAQFGIFVPAVLQRLRAYDPRLHYSSVADNVVEDLPGIVTPGTHLTNCKLITCNRVRELYRNLFAHLDKMLTCQVALVRRSILHPACEITAVHIKRSGRKRGDDGSDAVHWLDRGSCEQRRGDHTRKAFAAGLRGWHQIPGWAEQPHPFLPLNDNLQEHSTRVHEQYGLYSHAERARTH